MQNDNTGNRQQAESTTKTVSTVPTFTVELKQLKLSEIDDHPINPPRRIDAKRIKDLTSDRLIQAGRLVNPLKVIEQNGTYLMLDGHRRKTALVSQEIEAAMCLVYTITSGDVATIYASLNKQRKHRGDERAAIFRTDPTFIPEQEQKKFKKARDTLGDDGFDACVTEGIEPFRNSEQLARISAKTGKSMKSVKEWFFSGDDSPRTTCLRNFESEWNAAVDKDGIAEPSQQKTIRTCMRFAIRTITEFATRMIGDASEEDAA